MSLFILKFVSVNFRFQILVKLCGICLCLTYLTWYSVLKVHPFCCKWQDFILLYGWGQYSCLENPVGGGAWWATVHGVPKSRTWLSDFIHFSLLCIGEGNGNPLQWSCLENLREGGAWWAALYGVAQSRTRLKWLSSSSSMPYFCTLTVKSWSWTFSWLFY